MKRSTAHARKYFVFLSVLYLILVLLLPANQTVAHHYNLSFAQYHELLFVISLPLIAVWIAAFEGYIRLRNYSHSILDTIEGSDFQQLSYGVRWLAWGLPILSIVSIIANSIADSHHRLLPASIILINYVTLFIPLVAFSFMSEGSRGLLKHVHTQLSVSKAKFVIMLFVLLGVFFCFLTFRHLDLRSVNSSDNPYYLPVWLMSLTIIIPYLYAWFIGLLAAYEVYLFGSQAKGLFYRRPSKILAGGVVVVIGSSIALQSITSVVPRSGYLSLNALLITTYLINFGAAVGYLLIAVGARRLQKIEEV